MDMQIKTSVRNLIEFVMRSGDIDNRLRENTPALEGIKAHQKVQKSMGESYKSEYYLENKTSFQGVDFLVEGRADGLIEEGGTYTIDEIKSTTRDLGSLDGENVLHRAQAKCYAYFFAKKEDLPNIGIRLTYVNIDDYQTRAFERDFSLKDLEDFYLDLLASYLKFSLLIGDKLEKRNQSARALSFPYQGYRKGQRKMAVAVYTAILEKKKVFIDAPTGTGKTISTLFPAIKSMGEDLSDKIFYLTAKNTTSKEAIKSLYKLKEGGLDIRAVLLSSKEKICLNDQVKCNPDDCPFAKGHFDRVNDALQDILQHEDIMDFDTITSYAEKHRVCPLEFELDISTYADIVICDYNYIFDPNVYLRRFFDEIVGRYIFLIDEAHNLLERAREMYSFKLVDRDFMDLKENFDPKKDRRIISSIDKILATFEEVYERHGKKLFYSTRDYIEDFDKDLKKLIKGLEKFLIKERDHKNYDKILQDYFDLNHYLKIADTFTDGFYSCLSYDDQALEKTFEIKCLDPSKVLRERYDSALSTVFFSATLSPMNFYMEMLGAEDSLKLHLDLPFDRENFLLLARPLSTRYRDRGKNLMELSDTIHDFVTSKRGNYFIFFPSFSYMEDVYEDFSSRYQDEVICQERFMGEIERKKFLQKFTYDSALTAFLVLGGIFAEGVDLKGERLIGSMVVSVGMPGVSNDRNLIKDHFDQEGKSGFDFSYTYPGINKVFQAAGRVIRTESDKGVILLVDDRFLTRKYRSLYPRHWQDLRPVNSREELLKQIDDFWKEGKS